MDYRIALSPELDVNAEELVSAWNTSSECQKIAKAETVQASAQSFFEPSTAIVYFGGVLTSIAVGVIKDLIKDKIETLIKEKDAKKKAPEVESVLQPDGSYLIIVK